MSLYAVQLPVVDAGVSSSLYHDPLLIGASGGVSCLFDTAFPYCYPGGQKDTRVAATAPTDGAVLTDMSTDVIGHQNFTFNLKSAAGAVTYSGGGFDFSGSTTPGDEIVSPNTALASIWSQTNQYFLVAMYMKLPSAANWPNDLRFFASTDDSDGLDGKSNFLSANFFIYEGSIGITFIRETSYGYGESKSWNPVSPDLCGTVVQIGYYRNASSSSWRIKNAVDSHTASRAVGINNTDNFSTSAVRFGFPKCLNTGNGALAKPRFYRGWIEDLVVSGRDPVAVLDADWARVVSRNCFS